MLTIKNVKVITNESFIPICECIIQFNLESYQDCKSLGLEYEEEYYKALGKGIVEGIKVWNLK